MKKKSVTFTWLQNNWRPLTAITYIGINIFDFVIAPLVTTIFGNYLGTHYVWSPLTLQGGGMFHLSFGAILGAASWTHGQAEVENVKNQPDFSNVPVTKNEDHQLDDPHKEFDGYKRGIPKG